MKDTLICLACIAILLAFAAAWLSTLSAFHWNAEADRVMQNGLNASGILEDGQGATVPALNQGKPSLPCPECAGYVLTDWRRSPTVYGPNGLYKGQVNGNQFIWEKRPTMDNLFQKGKP